MCSPFAPRLIHEGLKSRIVLETSGLTHEWLN